MPLVINKNLKNFYRFLVSYLGKIIIATFSLLFLTASLVVIFDLKIANKSPKDHLMYALAAFEFNELNYQNISVTGVLQTDAKVVEELAKTIIKNNSSAKTRVSDNHLIKEITTKIKENFPWVKNAVVVRNLSGKSLDIKIEEYVATAIFSKNQKKILVDENGHNITEIKGEEFGDLIIISGNNADANINSLAEILKTDELLKKEIYSANWVGNRRWDIVLKDGLVIKLPDENLNEAWQRFVKIYAMKGSNLGTKVIDLRVGSKIYLQLNEDKK